MALLAELETAVKHESKNVTWNDARWNGENKRTIFLREQLPLQISMKALLLEKEKALRNGVHITQRMMLNGLFTMLKIYQALGNILYHPNLARHVQDSASLRQRAMWIGSFTTASQKPGPGEYEPKPVASRAGVTFSKFTPKAKLIRYTRACTRVTRS